MNKSTENYLDLAIYYGFHFLVFCLPLVFSRATYDQFDLPKVVFLRITTLFLLYGWLAKFFFSSRVCFSF